MAKRVIKGSKSSDGKCKKEEKGKVAMRLEDIRKTYHLGETLVHALNGVDFDICEGERITIIGPSGSGKSTLLNMLGLLDVPSEGNVYLDGTNTTELSNEERAYFRGKKIGFIFQAFHLIPSVTALENVSLPMMFYDVPEEERNKRAADALERLGMGKRLEHLPKQLSGGERQRVAIARAIVNDPVIVLADEPTGNLDSKSGAEVLKIFDELHKEGRTIIIVTHEVNIARRSKKLVKLKDGKIDDVEVRG